MPRTHRYLVLVALLAAVCRPAVETEPLVAPEPAPEPDPAPEPEPEPEPAPEPEPKPAPTIPDEEMLSVKLHDTATSAGGIAVRFVSRSHKHAVSGASEGIWALELAHEGRIEQLEVRGQALRVEHAFAGQLLVITEPVHESLQVDLRANPQAPATPEEARARLVEMLAERGVAVDGGVLSHSHAHGVLTLSVMRGKDVVARAEFGLYSRELLSLRRPLAAAFRPRRGKPLEKFRIDPGRSKTTSSGAVVRWARQSHKHRVGGGAVGIWSFTVKKDGETKSVGLTDESLYAELAAFDQVYTFGDDDEGRVTVRVYPKKGGRLGENRALAKVEALGKKLGLDADGSVISQDAGAYEVLLRKKDRDLILAKVGVYTHRITDYVLRDRPAGGRNKPSPID